MSNEHVLVKPIISTNGRTDSVADIAPLSGDQWLTLIHELGAKFAEREIEHDRDDSFVSQNYAYLKAFGLFGAFVPRELGGGGLSFAEMANLLRTIAHYSPATALASSMHQHLVGVNVWKYKNGKGAADMLKNVAIKQPILISTGAKDWLESNGSMEKVDGGYLVSGYKYFASQSAIGNIAVTSAPYEDPEAGWQVLHFTVPMDAEGVSVIENWQTLGMRGTGSHTIKFDKVFVPEAKIALRRPRGEYAPVWNAVLTVAMPLIMSVYVGIAEKAAELAIERVKTQAEQRPYVAAAVAEMNNVLKTAVIVWEDMLRLNNNFGFAPIDQNGHEILTRKTIVANACVNVVAKAMEIIGGQGFYRSHGIEKLFRDVQAAKYHPLAEKEQLEFSGEFLLK
ncbi:MAG: acyl-CoA dehydrogenase family protein [Chloroflexota bacterium]